MLCERLQSQFQINPLKHLASHFSSLESLASQATLSKIPSFPHHLLTSCPIREKAPSNHMTSYEQPQDDYPNNREMPHERPGIIPFSLQKLGGNSIDFSCFWRHWNTMVQISMKWSTNWIPPIHSLGSNFDNEDGIKHPCCSVSRITQS